MQILFDIAVSVCLLVLTVSRIAHQRDENQRFDRLNGRVDLEQIERGKFRREATDKLHKMRCRLFRIEARGRSSEVEHQPSKLGVAGSIPAVRSTDTPST